MNARLKLAATTIAALIAAAPAAAVPAGFVANNDLGGDGFVVEISALRFDLIGSSDGIFDNLFTYSQIAPAPITVSGQFRYLTRDRDGSRFDPAGYFINNDFFQLSDDAVMQHQQNFGTFSFNVNANDRYGFYVQTTDGQGGRGILTVGAIPEPSSWAMLIAGFGVVGASLRRRRAMSAAS